MTDAPRDTTGDDPTSDEPTRALQPPARRPTPGRSATPRPAPSPVPAEKPDEGPDEETVRLTPLTDDTNGESSPPEPPDAGADEETVALPRGERSSGVTDAPSRVSDDDSDLDDPPPAAPRKKRSTAGVIILVLLALLGFTLAIQLGGKSGDSDLAAMREDDLVRLQSDLQAQEDRLQREIASLQDSQRQLQSGAQGRTAALEEATKRADELAILAGAAKAQGPGLTIRFVAGPQAIAASDILNAVQELRGADAEAMQIAGADGTLVRIVASTYFIDAEGGLEVSGKRLTGPYTITVIGDPPTMRTALNIPDGLVPSIKADGGNVIVDEHDTVEVTAIAAPVDLEHAKPVS
ncbi:Uncharacterized conserved protein YlxW, UPF0749 family [Asanoa hainanensis]|uniref:Uncharacterized conserved protein YlxW, UPF0749 family n=1 Tax=Asanoa hainanensis TaxID=560556 RepID=A0A239G0A9_9ACTN|nr:DUF881 domain-containing protein [Asanoa hainanensis]SNS61903.1 Uncharacterized conserved protein YlxW, UPF0749 family [Asanoa hainanensis]